MKYDVYLDFEYTDDFSLFDFFSHGKNGPLLKRIAFTRTEHENVFNLAFGDVDKNDKIDDCKISDNGDRNKILATVVYVVGLYTNKYPERWILFRGSTKGRTRLYRMAIGINLEELSERFEIYGLTKEGPVFFYKNMDLNAFVIKRKIV
jgi:hypothetical protein